MTLLYRDLMRSSVRGGSHLWINGTLSSELTLKEFFGVEPDTGGGDETTKLVTVLFMNDLGKMMGF